MCPFWCLLVLCLTSSLKGKAWKLFRYYFTEILIKLIHIHSSEQISQNNYEWLLLWMIIKSARKYRCLQNTQEWVHSCLLNKYIPDMRYILQILKNHLYWTRALLKKARLHLDIMDMTTAAVQFILKPAGWQQPALVHLANWLLYFVYVAIPMRPH